MFQLRARLGPEPRAPRLSDHFILALAGSRRVTLRVDAVEGLVEVPEAAVDRAARALGEGLYEGAVALDDELVLLHDLDRFLSTAEAAAVEAALAETTP